MLPIGNSSDRNDDIAYMHAETGQQYLFPFFKYFKEIYGKTYMERWPTATELIEIERKYRRKRSLDASGELTVRKYFGKTARCNKKVSIKIAKTYISLRFSSKPGATRTCIVCMRM